MKRDCSAFVTTVTYVPFVLESKKYDSSGKSISMLGDSVSSLLLNYLNFRCINAIPNVYFEMLLLMLQRLDIRCM
jgi:hypothetical protein